MANELIISKTGTLNGEGKIQDDTFPGCASKAEIDRDGEVVLPDAYSAKLPGYMDNAVMLACHKQVSPEGKALIVAKCVSAMVQKDGLYIKGTFADTDLGREYRYLYENKFIRGLSVGFMPEEYTDTKMPDGGYGPRVFTKVELVEISFCAVPSNRGSLLEYRATSKTPQLIDIMLKDLDLDLGKEVKIKTCKGEGCKNHGGKEQLFADLVTIKTGLAELKTLFKPGLMAQQMEEYFDDLKGELLDPNGLYARAMANRAATEADGEKITEVDSPMDMNAVAAKLAELADLMKK